MSILSLAEYKERCASLLKSASDPAQSSEILTQLSDTFGEANAELQLAKAENQRLQKTNEALVKENMRLFQKIPVGKSENETTENTQDDKKLSFDDLIDEKGKIK